MLLLEYKLRNSHEIRGIKLGNALLSESKLELNNSTWNNEFIRIVNN